jgi:hypothetical protein
LPSSRVPWPTVRCAVEMQDHLASGSSPQRLWSMSALPSCRLNSGPREVREGATMRDKPLEIDDKRILVKLRCSTLVSQRLLSPLVKGKCCCPLKARSRQRTGQRKSHLRRRSGSQPRNDYIRTLPVCAYTASPSAQQQRDRTYHEFRHPFFCGLTHH